VVDHVLLKGGIFLIRQLRGLEFGQFGKNAYLMAFAGVIVSFVMFSPIAGAVGVCGGLLGRRQHASDTT
jgi:hypothetical protein